MLPDQKQMDMEEKALFDEFSDIMCVEDKIDRKVVSFQDSKTVPSYRWYRYKEAFSPSFVSSVIDKYMIGGDRILDPFAGIGTALFASADSGLEADGIEILPLCQEIIRTRVLLQSGAVDLDRLRSLVASRAWKKTRTKVNVPYMAITKGAYPRETEEDIARYLGLASEIGGNIGKALVFALLCVAEDVSFTSKDGSCLRWDSRSGHTKLSKHQFLKTGIADFDSAISEKILEIVEDTKTTMWQNSEINLYAGSVFDIMPTMSSGYDGIITSPPYCNRYDYTRTYALELALLGIDDNRIKGLRQELLSSTVESRPKDLLGKNPNWQTAITATEKVRLLATILEIMDSMRRSGGLNNRALPRMIRGYFSEMACVIYECHRLLKSGARMVMVNDNVQYAGIGVPVDLILSKIAKTIGFDVEKICVLATSKGNSAQQMATYGRNSIRKGYFVWRKK